MTKDEVIRLAEVLESENMKMKAEAMMNTSAMTTRERVETSARYQVLKDKASVAEREYMKAFRSWQALGFPE